MFMACGTLYILDSTTEKETKVSVAVDLYLNKTVEVSLPFTNPFRKTTQLGYDHYHKVRFIDLLSYFLIVFSLATVYILDPRWVVAASISL